MAPPHQLPKAASIDILIQNARILIVSDDISLCERIQNAFAGHDEVQLVFTTPHAHAGTWLDQSPSHPSLILLDLSDDGAEASRRFESLDDIENLPPVILIAGKGQEDTTSRAQHEVLPRACCEHALLRLSLLRIKYEVLARRQSPALPEKRQRILEHTTDGILIVDQSLTVRFANPSANDMLAPSHTKNGELIGTAWTFPLREEPVEVETIGAGSERVVELVSGPIEWEGEPAHVITVRDVTRRKHTEEMLRESMEQARAAGRAKSDFLARMSHEIRTPMTGVIGMTELALATPLSPQQRDYLEMVKQSASSLLSILNDILDFSKIEAGQLSLEPAPFDLTSALEQSVQIFRNLSRQKGLSLEWSVDDNVPRRVIADSGRLRQIINNLLSNAIKFTASGRIQLHAALASGAKPDKRGTLLEFSVCDTGIGIPADKQQDIFALYAQVQQTNDAPTQERDTHEEGTGLGLCISRQLVELMGGHMHVESTPGQGSTFRFTFRAGLPEAADASSTPATETAPAGTALPALNILLVEDNPVNQIFATELLRQHGHTVTPATNGAATLELLRDNRYDVVLMDIQLPDTDGMQITRTVRDPASDVARHDVPIIAMTAHAMEGDRERFMSHGMNGYVSKPVEMETLFAVLAEVLDLDLSAPASAPATAQGPTTATGSTADVTPADAGSSAVHGPYVAFDAGWLQRMGEKRPTFAKRMFAVFIDEEPARMLKLEQAVKAGDIPELKFLAHSLKGACSTLGGLDCREAALRLELAAKGESDETPEDALPELKRQMQRLTDAMRAFIKNH